MEKTTTLLSGVYLIFLPEPQLIIRNRDMSNQTLALKTFLQVRNKILQMQAVLITQWITAVKPDVLLDVDPKGNYKIKQDRGTQGKERDIDKIFRYCIG
jgi:hypothetical protein